MKFRMQNNGAKLATLQGNYMDTFRNQEIHYLINRGYMTKEEASKYPELMGIIPIIAAVGAAIPAITTGVGGLLKTWSGVKSTEAQNKILAQQIAIESKKADQLKMGLMFGIPAALVLAVILSRRK